MIRNIFKFKMAESRHNENIAFVDNSAADRPIFAKFCKEMQCENSQTFENPTWQTTAICRKSPHFNETLSYLMTFCTLT